MSRHLLKFGYKLLYIHHHRYLPPVVEVEATFQLYFFKSSSSTDFLIKGSSLLLFSLGEEISEHRWAQDPGYMVDGPKFQT